MRQRMPHDESARRKIREKLMNCSRVVFCGTRFSLALLIGRVKCVLTEISQDVCRRRRAVVIVATVRFALY